VSERELAPGAVVADRYEIERPLDGGGYVVRDRAGPARRALRFLPATFDDAVARRRFVKEAGILQHLQARHVGRLYDAGVLDETPWVVTELPEGPSLGERVRERGVYAGRDAWFVLARIRDALVAAARVGIVHGGLRPERVYLKDIDVGWTEVTVHGFALDHLAGLALDLTPESLPRWRWIAPEQAHGDRRLPGAADVWSLGLLAFYVLTGKTYWTSDTPEALMREVLVDPLPSARERARDLGWEGALPEAFDAVLARCLDRDPTRRYEDATAVLHALGAALLPPEQPLMGNPKGSFYDDGLAREHSTVDREAIAEGTAGYRGVRERPDPQTTLRGNPKGSYYDSALSPRSPKFWILLVLLGIGAATYAVLRGH
jgi:eukaryotic-like serine/threonine-protein kinase